MGEILAKSRKKTATREIICNLKLRTVSAEAWRKSLSSSNCSRAGHIIVLGCLRTLSPLRPHHSACTTWNSLFYDESCYIQFHSNSNPKGRREVKKMREKQNNFVVARCFINSTESPRWPRMSSSAEFCEMCILFTVYTFWCWRELSSPKHIKKWSSLLPMIGRKIYFASSRHGNFRMKMIRWLVQSSAMQFFSSAAGWYIQNYNYQLVYFASLSNDSTKEVQSFLFHTLVTMSHRCKGKKREISSTHGKVLEASQEDSSLRFCRLPYILCAQSKRVEPMINATRYLLYSCKCSLSSLVAYSVPYTLYFVRTRLYH